MSFEPIVYSFFVGGFMAHQHGGYYSIDLYAFHSKLKGINPEFKLISALVALILTITLNNIYVSAYAFITMFFVSVLLGGMDAKEYLSMFIAPFSFIILASIGIALGLSFHESGDFNLKLGSLYIYTSKAQIVMTLKLVIKVFACVSIMQSLILSTMPYEIINALRNMHLPKLLVELMNLIYRFIFILIESYMNMQNSAASRLGYRNFKTSMTSFGNIASNILIVSLKKANAYYTAMEARCFDGDLNFLQDEKRLYGKNILAVFLFVLFMFFIWIVSLKLKFPFAV